MNFEQTPAYGNLREFRTSFQAKLTLSQVRHHFSLIVTAIYTFWLLLLKFIMNSTVFLIQHELIHRRDA